MSREVSQQIEGSQAEKKSKLFSFLFFFSFFKHWAFYLFQHQHFVITSGECKKYSLWIVLLDGHKSACKRLLVRLTSVYNLTLV